MRALGKCCLTELRAQPSASSGEFRSGYPKQYAKTSDSEPRIKGGGDCLVRSPECPGMGRMGKEQARFPTLCELTLTGVLGWVVVGILS